MAESKLVRVCVWSEDEDSDGDVWKTICGEIFIMDYGRPIENGFHYCCFCGLPLIEGTPENKDDYN